MKSLDNLSDVLTPEEAGSILKLSPEEVITLLESGHIPSIKVGPIWRILKTSLIDLLQPSGGPQQGTPHVRASGEMKIGALVRKTMTELLEANSLSAGEIERLKTIEYSNRVFALNFPLLKDYQKGHELRSQRMVCASNNEQYSRYWNIIFEDKFLITSEWNSKHRKRFIEWAQQFKGI